MKETNKVLFCVLFFITGVTCALLRIHHNAERDPLTHIKAKFWDRERAAYREEMIWVFETEGEITWIQRENGAREPYPTFLLPPEQVHR